jgi:hypothetical protein
MDIRKLLCEFGVQRAVGTIDVDPNLIRRRIARFDPAQRISDTRISIERWDDDGYSWITVVYTIDVIRPDIR